jgi:hypothetical protein
MATDTPPPGRAPAEGRTAMPVTPGSPCYSHRSAVAGARRGASTLPWHGTAEGAGGGLRRGEAAAEEDPSLHPPEEASPL